MNYKMMEDKEILKFSSFKSQVDPSFWQRLTTLKLDVDKLNENIHQIYGHYSNKKPEGQNQLFSVDASSFNKLPDENRMFGVGSIMNKNTIESFKESDKLCIIKNEGKLMMKAIKEEAVEKPYMLSRFLIFSFANLKNYSFYYWFAFPAPTFLSCSIIKPTKNICEVLSENQMKDLCDDYNKLNHYNKGFFFVKLENKYLKVFTVKEGLKKVNCNESWLIGFSDTSCTNHPSWPLRNFLTLISYHCSEFAKAPISVICLRLDFLVGQWKILNSIVLHLQINLKENCWDKSESGDDWVGWEKNERGKMGPRLASLKHYMDPISLAETSVDLNIKLMKWQILPDLNLNAIKSSKCLLIGAGTLGCAVARNLLSWSVRHITFVDYGVISFSNPVRQYLYKFKDTGKCKSETAAEALKEIFPGVDSNGFSFTVPMPGHPVGDSLVDETKKNVEKLEELIDSHDVVFLLMDSRESRWLPTLIASSKKKLVINAALGFDSYLVMRHGLKTSISENLRESPNSKLLTGDKLGCYFCCDVTAPGNSFRSRTLDQQCTVTRPGVSSIAAALAVELFVSILQHPLGGLAPADTDPEDPNTKNMLGMVPHSIRGFLSNFQTILPAVQAFTSCVACSSRVIDRYEKESFDFILKSLESKQYLEELCGLTELQNEDLIAEVLEYSDSD